MPFKSAYNFLKITYPTRVYHSLSAYSLFQALDEFLNSCKSHSFKAITAFFTDFEIFDLQCVGLTHPIYKLFSGSDYKR